MGLERGPRRAQALLGIAAEVPDGPEVLDHERRQPAGERGVADLRREPVHVACRSRRASRSSARPSTTAVRGVEHDVDRVHRVGIARPADARRRGRRDADARAPHARARGRAARTSVIARPTPPRSARTASPSRIVPPMPVGDAARVVALDLDLEAGVAEAHARVRHRGSPARAPAASAALARARLVERPVDEARRGRARRAGRRSARRTDRRVSPGSITTFAPASSARPQPVHGARGRARAGG